MKDWWKKCNSKLSGSVHNPRGRVVVQVALVHCQRFSGRFWERQMLMTAEVTEDRFLGVVSRTKNLPSNYFIMMSSIPPVPEATVVTITGWKRYSVGTLLDVRIMCFKWIPRIRGYLGAWIMSNWSSSTWFPILTSTGGVSLVIGPLINVWPSTVSSIREKMLLRMGSFSWRTTEWSMLFL